MIRDEWCNFYTRFQELHSTSKKDLVRKKNQVQK